MTAAPTALFAAAGVAAAVDWRAVIVADRRSEIVAKPLVTLLLVAAVATLTPASEVRRDAVLAALVLSLVGDVALLAPAGFLAGLGAFLAAHLAYVVGFAAGGGLSRLALVPSAVLLATAGIPVATRLVAGLRRSGEKRLVGPVLVYAGALSAMATCAIASGRWLAAVGGILFLASDTLLADDRFVSPRPESRVVVMVTYHLAQAALALALVL